MEDIFWVGVWPYEKKDSKECLKGQLLDKRSEKLHRRNVMIRRPNFFFFQFTKNPRLTTTIFYYAELIVLRSSKSATVAWPNSQEKQATICFELLRAPENF